VHLVDQPGAENHLDLPGIAEAAFHAFQLADRHLVDLAVIQQHQAQARGTVGGAGNIFFAAEQRQQRVSGCGNVHVHSLNK
jgi:GTPase involved in cell partitioning and DNA repair